MAENRTGTFAASPRANEAVVFGHSEEGRPLRVAICGRRDAPLRMLVIAGQHGDEPRARIATTRFLNTISAAKALPSQLLMAVVADLNPDGSVRNSRRNRLGVDLNRDHQLLVAAETRALHRFVRSWHPHVILDVHTYPPRRRQLLAKQLVHCHDIFLDVASHPACKHPLLDQGPEQLLQPLLDQLDSRKLIAGRYLLTARNGSVRHSTSSVVDARNGLALRSGALTLLVEGRGFAQGDGEDSNARSIESIQIALHAIMQWAIARRIHLVGTPAPCTPREEVPVRSIHRRSDAQYALRFLDLQTREVRWVTIDAPYARQGTAAHWISLPHAYAVPRHCRALIEVLDRHGFSRESACSYRRYHVEEYCIKQVEPSHRLSGSPRQLLLDSRFHQRSLADYQIFTAKNVGGRSLAVHLEPKSKYALHRFPEVMLKLKPGMPYPVLRVLDG